MIRAANELRNYRQENSTRVDVFVRFSVASPGVSELKTTNYVRRLNERSTDVNYSRKDACAENNTKRLFDIRGRRGPRSFTYRKFERSTRARTHVRVHMVRRNVHYA